MAKIPFSYLPSPDWPADLDNKLMLIDRLPQKDATLKGHWFQMFATAGLRTKRLTRRVTVKVT